MPVGLGEVHEFWKWLVDVYGSVSSLLIFFITYLIYQLKQEQKESKELRESNALAHAKQTEIQLSFMNTQHEQKAVLEKILSKVSSNGTTNESRGGNLAADNSTSRPNSP